MTNPMGLYDGARPMTQQYLSQSDLGSQPANVTCPNCQLTIETKIDTKISQKSWLMRTLIE